MKKILIVNKSFDLGGIQSSMVNMANELSRYYEVHLFLYHPFGALKERLNADVKILDSSWRFDALGMTIKDALKTHSLKIIAFRFFATIWSKLINNKFPISVAIKHNPKMRGYDLAIAYHQEQRKNATLSGFVRVVDQCVEARKKVAWLHFDSDAIDLDSEYNNQFYQRMDKIVCVSKSLMKNYEKRNPQFSSKMDYCYNFLEYSSIKEKSLVSQSIVYPENKIICFSACRLTEEKALVRGICAISDVLKKHKDIEWYIAGDGVERQKIEDIIQKCNLEEYVHLIGNQGNPYPYLRNADLLLNVSYHEAAPMVFFESKALGVPVFATRTASSDELLSDRIDSFICDNSEESIHEMFSHVMSNRILIERAKQSLKEYRANNNESLSRIEAMFG